MVQVRGGYSFNPDGSVNFEQWLSRLESYVALDDHEQLRNACELSWQIEQSVRESANDWTPGVSSYHTGLEMSEILAQLHLNAEAIVVALLYRPVRESRLSLDTVRDQFGTPIANLLEGVLRMAAINETDTSKRRVLGQSDVQVENVRKMLLALVDDVRVALIKLAERTCAIRALKQAGDEKRKRVAREIFDIYAPLAHRLGIGQLKWELEDLSFRYLEPENYKSIAKLIDERRVDRERFISEVTEELRRQFNRAGIDAEVSGRPKSIYSIWRKMQRKQLDFDQIYDIRAVRVLVPETRDCYTVLGIVHNLWRVIPNEFDDYIANPKANGYQSLHTAVIGPEQKVLEVQIRTFSMDDDAELGVCAHWRYKEGIEDPGYQDGFAGKIEWLRQVLAWHDEMGMVGGLAEQLRNDAESDQRVYVFTPEGHVVDLMAGATPLDFAYYVHTEVGNHCSGARVNDKIVPLNYQLKTGDRVEVISSELNVPSRDWLKPHLGYAQTPRAQAKIQQWFKSQDREQNHEFGQMWLETEFHRAGLVDIPYEEVARKLGCRNVEGLFVSVGTGTITVTEVVEAVSQVISQHAAEVLSQTAEHQTGEQDSAARTVEILIKSQDRAGLLRDITTILANESIYVLSIATHSDRINGTAELKMQIELTSWTHLLRALGKLNDMESIIEARRTEGGVQ